MKVRVYPEGGDDESAEEYDERPARAAKLYAEENREDCNLCVEALDDEAKALSGWHADEHATHFKVFTVRAVTTYKVTEV